MDFHNFKYTCITLLKNKALIFWTFAFPILLGTFFYMAFSDIEKNEQLDIIDIAIVETEAWKQNSAYQEVFKTLSDENNTQRLFHIEYGTAENAQALLEQNQITGYLLLEDKPKIVINKNGINETILKYVIEEIEQSEQMLQQWWNSGQNLESETWSKNLYQEIYRTMEKNQVEIVDKSSENLSYTMIEFYTLIAMAALYGGVIAMTAINQNLANMSHNGKRVSISPIPKRKLVCSSIFASLLIQLVGMLLLFAYTIFILKVDYGNQILEIILLSLVGSFAGLSLGLAVACLLKTNENTKIGILLSITMLGCFLSGMMGITMKYIIDKNIPIVNKLNPANMITDGFYALYYYDTLDRFYWNVISLLIFAILMILLSTIQLRRQKYDSI